MNHPNIDGYIFYENGDVFRNNYKINGYVNDNGYLTFQFKNKKKQIHRIIAELFVNNPNKYNFIEHIDKNKLNNNFNNLKWVSQKNNKKVTIQYNKELLINYINDNIFKIECEIPEKVTSETKFNINCKTCNNEYIRTFKSLHNVGQLCDLCSKKEANKKRESFCINKYGVSYISQKEEIKDKIKNTVIEKYGVNCVLQNESIKEQIKETNLKKYGVEHNSQTKDYKEKYRNT